MRTCGRCGESKSVENFAWRRKAKGQRDNYCRPCRSQYKREHYLANKQRYVDNAARRRRQVALDRLEFLFGYFRDHPCVDCGETDPLVLDFDHLGDKLFNVTHGIKDRSWEALLAEIAKCEVRCANCHRRRTARSGGFLRAAVAQRQSLALPRR